MKKNFSLSIPNSCQEKWDTFTVSPTGGYCGSCSKVVIDFTKMGDDEILDYFANRPSHACGRFRADQLKTYVHTTPAKIYPGFTLLKAGLLSLLLLVISKQASAQHATRKAKREIAQYPNRVEISAAMPQPRTIKGVVKDEYDELLPGINVVLQGTDVGTATNAEGYFVFPQKLNEGDVLIFTFIGYTSVEYVVPKETKQNIEISMKQDIVTLMGEVAVNDVYTEPPSGFGRLWRKVKGVF